MQLRSKRQSGTIQPGIKEAEVCHTTNSGVLQQTHRGKYASTRAQSDSRRKIGFPHLCGWICSSLMSLSARTHGALMYPLQLLTSNVPLATILGMPPSHRPQLAENQETQALLMDAKWQCHSSDQGVSTPRQEEAVEHP